MKETRRMERKAMYIEFDCDSILSEISEIISMARELERKAMDFQRNAGTIKIIEAPEKPDASK